LSNPEAIPETIPEDPHPAPKKKIKFSFYEPVAGIIFALVAAIIFYFFPQIITIVFIGGRLIPTFDAEVIQSLWIPILIWAILRLGVEFSFLIERRYTERLAVIASIGNILTAVVTFIIFFNVRIVYWEYIDFVHKYFADVAEWFGKILARPNLIILVIILIVLIIETINVIKKGRMSKSQDDRVKKSEIVTNEVDV